VCQQGRKNLSNQNRNVLLATAAMGPTVAENKWYVQNGWRKFGTKNREIKRKLKIVAMRKQKETLKGLRWKTTLDGRLTPLPRYIRENGRRLAVCGALPLRRLDRGPSNVLTATNSVIVGVTGMVGGYALR
jgi:hypothetical protein